MLMSQSSDIRDESTSRDSGYASHDSPSPARDSSPPTGPQREAITDSKFQERSNTINGPHMFYVEKSQHFNQSDFGILFPWITRRFAKAEEPERILELNTRAVVEVMRQSGIGVAGGDDAAVLSTEDGRIRRWVAIPCERESEMEEVVVPQGNVKTSLESQPEMREDEAVTAL